MGLSFKVGHPDDVIGGEFGELAIEALRSNLGAGVPLGVPGELYDTLDALKAGLAWEWWKELQELAEELLGQGQAPHLARIDAWMGLYLDMRTEPGLVWPEGGERQPHESPEAPPIAACSDPPPADEEDVEAMMADMMQAMFEDMGPRSDEADALQVGDVRSLREELRRLAEALGYNASDEAMQALAEYYLDDERIDDDGPVQALTHLWIASSHAVATGAPLWIVK